MSGPSTSPVLNLSGSAGKSTSAVALADQRARAGRRMVLIDADAQANASYQLGVQDPKWTTGDVLLKRCDITDAIVETRVPNLWLLPASASLNSDAIELVRLAIGAEQRLGQAVRRLEEMIDQVVVDCPGQLTILTINALVAARGRNDNEPAYAITVTQPTLKEIQGIHALEDTIGEIAENYNPQLQLGAIIPCIVPDKTQGKVYEESLDKLGRGYGDLMTPPVRRSVRVPEAYARQQTLHEHAPTDGVTLDYNEVGKALVERGVLV